MSYSSSSIHNRVGMDGPSMPEVIDGNPRSMSYSSSCIHIRVGMDGPSILQVIEGDLV